MSGVLIDVDLNTKSAKKNLSDLNKSLAASFNSASISKSAFSNISLMSKGADKSSNALFKLGNTGSAALNKINNSAVTTNRSMSTLGKSVAGIVTVFAGLGTASYFARVGDDLTLVQNKLKLVTKGQYDLLATEQKLYKLSTETRGSFKQLSGLYADVAKSLEDKNIAGDQIIKLTKTISQAGSLSGSSLESISAGLMQLRQALSSGVLRGEELNSVLEQIPYLGQGIAKSMKLSTGQLRQFGAEGKLTSSAVIKAIEDMAASTDADFKKTTATVQQGTAALKQAFEYFLGSFDQNFSLTKDLGAFLINAAKTVDKGSANVLDSIDGFLNASKKIAKKSLDLSSIFSVKANLVDTTGFIKYNLAMYELASTFIKLKNAANFSFGFKVDLKETAKEIPRLLYNVAGFFKVLYNNLATLAPIVSSSAFVALSSFSLTMKKYKAIFDAVLVKTIIPFTNKLDAINEYISFFRVGDKGIERAWSNLFRSDSLKDFIDNLELLNIERSKLRLDDKFVVLDNAYRNLTRIGYKIQEILYTIGLADGYLLKFNNISLDNLLGQFKMLGSIVSRIFRDIITPNLVPLLVGIKTFLLSVKALLIFSIRDTFNEAFGKTLAQRLFKVLRGIFSSVSSLIKNIEKVDVSSIFSIGGDGQVFGAFKKFIKGFSFEITNLFSSTFDNLFDKILSTLDSSLSKVISKIKEFSNKIKGYFFDIYDKVVGHSYWPDMIDGVISYTSNIFKAVSPIKAFALSVKREFEKLSDVILKSDNKFSRAFDVLLNGMKNFNIGDFAGKLASNLTASILAAFALLTGGPRLKLAAFSYFASMFDFAIQGALSAAMPILAEGLGNVAGLIASNAANGFIRLLDIVIAELPNFVETFMTSFDPITKWVYDIASMFSLFHNRLLYAAAGIAAVYAVFAKNGFKDIQELLFGREKTKKKSATLGLIPEVLGSIGVASFSGKFLDIFKDKTFAAAGAAAIASAMLDSINIFEAAQVAVPLLGYAILGKDGGNRLLGETLGFVTTIVKYTYGAFLELLKKLDPTGALANFFDVGALFKRMTSKANTTIASSALGVATEKVFEDFKQIFKNLSLNAERYASKQFNLAEAFLNTPLGEDPSNAKAFKKVKLGEDLANVWDTFINTDLGGTTLKSSFENILDLFNQFKDSFKRIFQTAGLGATVVDFTTSTFGKLKTFMTSWLSLMLNGVSSLFGLLKNKVVAFTVLTAGVTSIASAADNTASSVGILSESISSLGATILASVAISTVIGSLGKLNDAYRRGRDTFVKNAQEGLIAAKTAEIQQEKEAILKAFDLETPSKRKTKGMSKEEIQSLNAYNADILSKRRAIEGSFSLRQEAEISAIKSTAVAGDVTAGWKEVTKTIRESAGQVREFGSELFTYFRKSAAIEAVKNQLVGIKKQVSDILSLKGGTREQKRAVIAMRRSINALKEASTFSESFSAARVAFKESLDVGQIIIDSVNKGESSLVSEMQRLSSIVREKGLKNVFKDLTSPFRAISLLTKPLREAFSSVASAAFGIVAPILKLGLLGGGAGLLAVSLFGPGRTFADNLQWAYDTVREMFGLKPTTNFGKLSELKSILEALPSELKFDDILFKIDFSKIDDIQQKALKSALTDLASQYDSLRAEVAMQAAGATAAQERSRLSIERKIDSLLSRYDTKPDQTSAEISESTKKLLTKPEESISAYLVEKAVKFQKLREAGAYTSETGQGFRFSSESIQAALAEPLGAITSSIRSFVDNIKTVFSFLVTVVKYVTIAIVSLAAAFAAIVLFIPALTTSIAGFLAVAAGIGTALLNLDTIYSFFVDVFDSLKTFFVDFYSLVEQGALARLRKLRAEEKQSEDILSLARKINVELQKNFDKLPDTFKIKVASIKPEVTESLQKSLSASDISRYSQTGTTKSKRPGGLFSQNIITDLNAAPEYMLRAWEKVRDVIAEPVLTENSIALREGESAMDAMARTYQESLAAALEDPLKITEVETKVSIRDQAKLIQEDLNNAANGYTDAIDNFNKNMSEGNREALEASKEILRGAIAVGVEFDKKYGKEAFDYAAILDTKFALEDVRNAYQSIAGIKIDEKMLDLPVDASDISLIDSIRRQYEKALEKEPKSIEEANKQILKQIKYTKQLNAVKENALAKASYSTNLERESLLSGQPVSRIESFKTSVYSTKDFGKLSQFDAILKKIEQVKMEMDTLDPLNPASARTKASKEKVIKGQQALLDQMLPNKNTLDTLNSGLKSINVPEIDFEKYLKIPQAVSDKFIADIEKVKNAKDLFDKSVRDTKAPEIQAEALQKWRDELKGLTTDLENVYKVQVANYKAAPGENAATTARNIEKLIGEAPEPAIAGNKGKLAKFNELVQQRTKAELDLQAEKEKPIVDQARYGMLQSNLEGITKSLEKLKDTSVTTFDAIIGKFDELGFAVDKQMFASFSAKDQKRLKDMGQELVDIETKLNETSGKGLGKDTIKAIADRQENIMETARDIFVKYSAKSGKMMNAALGRLGLGEDAMVATFSKDTMMRLLDVDIFIENMKRALLKTKDISTYIINSQMISEKLKEVSKLKEFFDLRSSFEKSTEEGLLGGAKVAFDKIKSMSGLSNMSFKAFLNIPEESRKKTLEQSSSGEFLSKLNLASLTDDQKAIFNKLAAGADPVQIAKELANVRSPELEVLEDIRTATQKTANITPAESTSNTKDVPVLGTVKTEGSIGSKFIDPMAELKLDEYLKSIPEKAFNDLQKSTISNLGKMRNAFEHYNVSFTDEWLKASDLQAIQATELVTKIGEINKQLTEDVLPDDKIRELKKSVDDYRDQLDKIKEKIDELDMKKAAEDAGKAFSSDVSSGFKEGIKDLVKGKSTFKEFTAGMLDKVTGSITDTFIEGLTKPLTEKAGGMISDLGKGVFSVGSATFSSLFGDKSFLDSFNSTFGQSTDQGVSKNTAKTVTVLERIETLMKTMITGSQLESAGSALSKIPSLFAAASPLAGKLSSFTSDSAKYFTQSGGWDPVSMTNTGTTVGEGMMKMSKADMFSSLSDKSGMPTAVGDSAAKMEAAFTPKFESMANTMETSMSGALSSDSSIFSTLKTSFSEAFTGIGKLFTEGFGSIGNLFSSGGALSGIGNLFKSGGMFSFLGGFASGGAIRGPGTGTSDSIVAMVSNGEFVVNAAATKEHLGLLQALNSGKTPKFATGGLIGDTSAPVMLQPNMVDIKPVTSANAGSQQMINLTITGDISRQTKAEIYRMLPNIAEGVNNHNKERGYRR
jgi:tape measure domain-containing protein